MPNERKRTPPKISRSDANPPIPLAVASSQPEPQKGVFVKHDQVMRAKSTRRKRPGEQTIDLSKWNPFTFPLHPKGVVPEGHEMAQDSDIQEVFGWAGLASSTFAEGLSFMGFTELSILLQRPEFRVISQTLAEEMTREWIEFDATSGKSKEDKQGRINELEDAIREFKLKEACELAAFQDGGFGRSHIYIDCCDVDDRQELVTSIGNGQDYISQAKWSKDAQKKPKDAKVKGAKLKGFRNVEPVWCYPNKYNSIDPLKGTWYKPETWFVMGKEVHHTRLLTFIGRPVPDILKPAYSFGGLSMTQQAKPYVDNWLRTRQSVADLVRSFVVQGLKTNLAVLNQAGGDALVNRMELFNAFRDNHDSFLLDKDTEEWFNVTTSLASLDALQAQSQEQMSSVSRIPLVKLLGISPHGLNATAEPEIRVFYDTIKSMQEKFFRDHLTTCIHFVMLHLWGQIDDEITFHFKDLWQLDEVARVANEKVKTDIDDANIAMGSVSAEEVRERLAKDPHSIYSNIDLTGPPPEPPEPEGGPGGEGGKPGEEAKDPSDPLANSVTNKAAKSLGGFPGDNGAPDFAKSDVAFEHPAKGKDSCLECEHFQDGSDTCELVRGVVRPEDWCELFEPEVGLGHWLLVVPPDADSDDFGAQDEIDWEEKKHPRDKSGQFTSGAGGGGGKPQFPASHYSAANKTKVKNSIVKTLAAHGYKKAKQNTAAGHHVFEHPSGHKVFVGPSVPNQEFVSGYRLAGTHKYGSGAGSLAKHLAQHHGAPASVAAPKPAQTQAKVEGHHASALHSKITIAGGVPYASNSETVNYKFPDASELIVGKKHVPNTGTYPWVFVPTGQQATSGAGGVAFEKAWQEHTNKNQKSQPTHTPPPPPASKPVTVPPKAAGSITQEAYWSDAGDNGLQPPQSANEYAYESENGYGSIVVGSQGAWKIFHYNSDGSHKATKQGEGQESLNAAFEALHPRGAHGEFIKKPGNEITDEFSATYALIEQNFKEAVPGVYEKGPVTVSFGAGSSWQVSLDGKVINAGFGNFDDIFNTKFSDVPPVKTAPNQEVVPPAQPQKAVGHTLGMSEMKQVGPQLGSNEGGQYEDGVGNKYYIKKPKSNDHAKNELLAAALFAAAGGNTLKYHQIVDGEKLYVGTDWQQLDKSNINQMLPSEKAQARKDFAIHAWLANWDAAGIDNSNQAVVNGKVVPVDFGGSLLYRAQGGLKGHLFDNEANEWNSLRNPSLNPNTAALYGTMTPTELKESAQRLENVTYDQIKDLVQQYGPGSPVEKAQLIQKLVSRREAILQKANQKPPPPVQHEAGTGTVMPGKEYSKSGGGYGGTLVVDPSQPDKTSAQVYQEVNDQAMKTAPMTYQEHAAIDDYKGIGYDEMNGCMRYLEDCSHLPQIQVIRDYLSKARVEKPLTVFRGMHGPYVAQLKKAFAKAHSNGKPAIFADPGFNSVSTSESTALNFAHSDRDSMFIIEVPAGTHGGAVNNASEQEIMLQQGTRFVVTGRDKLTGYWKARVDQSHMKEKED